MLCCDVSLVFRLVANNRVSRNRTLVIEWMKKTFGVQYRDERDTSIQIFNKVLLLSFAEDERKIEDVSFLFHLAAASIIIACKLSDGNSHISEASFAGQLNVQVLRNFEREILATSRCGISNQCTPINFVRCLMNVNPVGLGENVDKIMDTVDTLLSEFWEEPESLLFSPCTIAISAMLISFSMLRIYCSSWLESVPDFCFPAPGEGGRNTNAHHPSSSVSPTSVSELCDVIQCSSQSVANGVILSCIVVHLLQVQGLLPEHGFKVSSLWNDKKKDEADVWAQLLPSIIVATLTHGSWSHLSSNMF
eukprot:gene32561-42177_t